MSLFKQKRCQKIHTTTKTGEFWTVPIEVVKDRVKEKNCYIYDKIKT